MNRHTLISIVIGCTAIFSGCKPDDSDNWTRYEYLDEARDYIYFKTGTWWVYKRIPGGDLDTFDVIKSFIDTIKLTGDGNTLYYEYLDWTAKSRLDDYSYKFSRGSTILPDPSYASDYMMRTKAYAWNKSRPGDFSGEPRIFVYPFDTNWVVQGAVSNIQLINELPVIQVQNITYNDVKRFEVSNDATFIYDDLGRSGGVVQYYWAPHVGIVKKEHMTKDIVWELIDSHIIQ